MGRYIVIFRDNLNEEFDVNGFKIMTEKELAFYEELANSISWEFAFYANNESLYYLNGEDLLSRLDYKEISLDEYEMLDKIFNGEFGTFINEEFLQNILDGEDSYEEDEYDDDSFDDSFNDDDDDI